MIPPSLFNKSKETGKIGSLIKDMIRAGGIFPLVDDGAVYHRYRAITHHFAPTLNGQISSR
jgi:hypothetical protein